MKETDFYVNFKNKTHGNEKTGVLVRVRPTQASNPARFCKDWNSYLQTAVPLGDEEPKDKPGDACVHVYTHVCLCACVCMPACACMYACVHCVTVYMHVSLCACMPACMYTYMCVSACVHACACTYACVHVCARIHACVSVRACACLHVHVCMPVCTRVCMPVYTHVCACLWP